jgi:hypothetical protein
MKLHFVFGFSSGQLSAEVDNFEDADKVLQYALQRGVVNVSVATPDGQVVQADVAAEDTPFEGSTPLAEPPFDEPTDQVPDQVTVEDAQQAVKDYAAKHGIEKGRALLAKFGFKRTNEITADKAAEIVGACNE